MVRKCMCMCMCMCVFIDHHKIWPLRVSMHASLQGAFSSTTTQVPSPFRVNSTSSSSTVKSRFSDVSLHQQLPSQLPLHQLSKKNSSDLFSPPNAPQVSREVPVHVWGRKHAHSHACMRMRILPTLHACMYEYTNSHIDY
jgi:hypothetical protein